MADMAELAEARQAGRFQIAQHYRRTIRFRHFPQFLFHPRPHTRSVIDDEAKMAAAVLVRGRVFHQVDELVAELDKGVARPFGPEREVKDLAVEIESLVDIADFERDVVDADKPRLLGIGLAGLGHPRPSCC